MCDDCIVVNGQRQISLTKTLNINKSRVTYKDTVDNTNQTVNILKSSIHIAINSDLFNADKSQIVNIYDSNVCVEVRPSCTANVTNARTIVLTDSTLKVLLSDKKQSPIRVSVASGGRESVEYSTVRKEPKSSTSSSYVNTPQGQNGGYTALNCVGTDTDDTDYCIPSTSYSLDAPSRTQATVHKVDVEVPLAHISPYPAERQRGPSESTYAESTSSPESPPIYTVPQPTTQERRPTSANSDYNPYSCLIGPVKLPSNYTIPKRPERPSSQSDGYTDLTHMSPMPPTPVAPLMVAQALSIDSETSPPDSIPGNIATSEQHRPYSVPEVPPPVPPHATFATVPAKTRPTSEPKVPQLPCSFRPVEKQEAQKTPKELPNYVSRKKETSPPRREPLYAIPTTMQKKQIGEIPPYKPKPTVLPTEEVFQKEPVKKVAKPPPRPPRVLLPQECEPEIPKNVVPVLKARNRPLSVEIRCHNARRKKNPRPVSLPDDEALDLDDETEEDVVVNSQTNGYSETNGTLVDDNGNTAGIQTA